MRNEGRIHGAQAYLGLKTAMRRLTRAVGGQESAASITRVRAHQTIGRYGRPQDAEHAPVDVVADLEADVGEPIVTRVLADLLGYVLVKKTGGGGPRDWTANLGALAKEAGEAIARLGEAYASGGTITAEESTRMDLRREVREAMEVLGRIDRMLRELEGLE